MKLLLDTLLDSVAAAGRRLRREQSGLTLIEVVVSALLVVLIGGSFVALGAVQTTTGDQQRRSQAADLAQQDQERMRGMSADQLSNLSQERDVTVDGVVFKVKSYGKFINRSTGGDTCPSLTANGSADYIRIETRVDWASNDRTEVIINGLATPPAGGGVVTRTVDQNGAAVAGAKILASGSSSATLGTRRSGTTDASGCTIFPGMPVGDYDLSASLSGYVNPDGAATSSSTVTATTTGTATRTFPIGRAGTINAAFSTVIGGATLTGQRAPSIGWSNAGMATPRYVTPSALASSISSGASLYPFIAGSTNVYTNNYGVWAGSCSAAYPPSSRTFTTVAPGAPATPTVLMPGMDLEVRWRPSASGSGTRVVPSAVKLTDSCNQSWFPTVSSAGATAATGVLTYPGQPYGTYTICASYVSGGVTYKRTLTGVGNTNFAGSLTNLVIDGTGSASVRGTC